MSERHKKVRLFVGLYPPIEDAQNMLALLDSVTLATHRVTRTQQVHLTVQFIGDRRADEIPTILESVRRSAAGIARLELQPVRLVTLPERGKPRLIAIETDAPPGLLQLHRRLVTRLARRAREKPNDRFRPHFTLCRFGRAVSVDRFNQPVGISSFTIDKVALMQSVIHPDGAMHDEVGAASLT